MLTNVKNTNLQKKYSTDLNRPFTEETPQKKRQSPPGGQRNGTRDGGGDTAPGDRRQRGRPTLRGGGEAAPPAPGLELPRMPCSCTARKQKGEDLFQLGK